VKTLFNELQLELNYNYNYKSKSMEIKEEAIGKLTQKAMEHTGTEFSYLAGNKQSVF
jgi:hypothetical protein